MQCKDISSYDILMVLKDTDEYNWFHSFEKHEEINPEHSIFNGFPDGVSRKLVLAKMYKLIKRGLVGGCACGCRGDFYITEKGKSKAGLFNGSTLLRQEFDIE